MDKHWRNLARILQVVTELWQRSGLSVNFSLDYSLFLSLWFFRLWDFFPPTNYMYKINRNVIVPCSPCDEMIEVKTLSSGETFTSENSTSQCLRETQWWEKNFWLIVHVAENTRKTQHQSHSELKHAFQFTLKGETRNHTRAPKESFVPLCVLFGDLSSPQVESRMPSPPSAPVIPFPHCLFTVSSSLMFSVFLSLSLCLLNIDRFLFFLPLRSIHCIKRSSPPFALSDLPVCRVSVPVCFLSLPSSRQCCFSLLSTSLSPCLLIFLNFFSIYLFLISM